MLLRPLLRTGDYLVVEDGCVNGHPVHPGWGEGPFEAIEAYFQVHPDDYVHDVLRERKFGFTFAPNGFLRRR
jgi:cephalosporin hydroxylase